MRKKNIQLTAINRSVVLRPETDAAVRKVLDAILMLPERARIELESGFIYGNLKIVVETTISIADTDPDKGIEII